MVDELLPGMPPNSALGNRLRISLASGQSRLGICSTEIRSATITSNGRSNITRLPEVMALQLRCGRPQASASKTRISFLEATNATLAAFKVEVAAGGGALTSTRIAGNNFSLSLSRSGADLTLTPRTQLGASGASVPIVLGITDAGGATLPRTYVVRPSGSNYIVSAFDAAGAQISFATAGVSFNVLLGPVAVGT